MSDTIKSSGPYVSLFEQCEAFKLWKSGESVELWYPESQTWRIHHSTTTLVASDIIRRKPQPKLRPWKASEVPIDAMFRHRANRAGWTRLLGADGEQYQFAQGNGVKYETLSGLFNEGEFSTDKGVTWLPCGIVE